MTGAALIIVLGTLIYLPACGNKSTATTSTGTQPGTYAIAIKATSGTFTTPPTANPLTFSLTVTP